MKLLIVEDNAKLLEAISETLESESFLCETSLNFQNAHEKIFLYNYDVFVVDINLPDGSGLELIKEMKTQNPSTGIIVISAGNSLDNKIEGLDLGADDYITKPFDMAELVARIKALLRRRNFSGNSRVTVNGISIDTASREVFAGKQKIELTKSEYDILLFFFSNPGRTLTKESIAEHIWGDNMDLADSFDFIYSHIKNLRKKISAAGVNTPIKAVYGIGYKLDSNPTE
ncbi:response regulator [Maribellus comscasis]|uniref:Response regulator n=1 Tax=Maribellus comscasis TaxID=2681766 RepID=A0A6I6JIS5_9BACT|nr:response regulator transcription factor [Maribellus comscasis]QGY42765.1 response regulator [Maribellus comscasis]